MLGIGKNMGIALLSITVIFAGLSFTIAQDVEETPVSDSGFISGYVILKVLDENGVVIAYRESHNTIVTTGLNSMVDVTFPGAAGLTTSGAVTHMDIGTDDGSSVALAFNNAGLGTEMVASGCLRDAFDSVVSTGAVSDGGTPALATIDVTVTSTFLGDTCGGETIDEVGVFNDLTTGEMFARSILSSPVPALGSTDTLVIDWTFTFTDK